MVEEAKNEIDPLRDEIDKELQANRLRSLRSYGKRFKSQTSTPRILEMDLQSLMDRDPASGFPQIIGQILSNLDFDSLIACRAVNRTWKNFLEEDSQRYIWIRAINEDRKNYLDQYLDPEWIPEAVQVVALDC